MIKKISHARATMIAGASFFVLSLLLLFVIIPTQVKDTSQFGVSPRLFPQVCAVLITVFSFLLFLEGLNEHRKGIDHFIEIDLEGIKLLLISGLILIAYQLLVYRIGYIIVASVFLMALMYCLGQRNIPTILICGLGVPICIFLFFTKLMKMSMP